MKVLFHIDESAKWPLVLQNVKNLVAYCTEKKDDAQIEIVANSQAVSELSRSMQTFSDEFSFLSESGVKIAACANALRNLSIEPEQLYEYVTVVPAGVVELAGKQEKGYGYIKP